MKSGYPLWMKFLRAATWLMALLALGLWGWLAVVVMGFVIAAAAFLAGLVCPEVAAEAEGYFQQEQRHRPYTWWLI